MRWTDSTCCALEKRPPGALPFLFPLRVRRQRRGPQARLSYILCSALPGPERARFELRSAPPYLRESAPHIVDSWHSRQTRLYSKNCVTTGPRPLQSRLSGATSKGRTLYAGRSNRVGLLQPSPSNEFVGHAHWLTCLQTTWTQGTVQNACSRPADATAGLQPRND